MSKVIADITMSLDGYVTGPGADEQHGLGDAPELHTWVTEQDAVDTEILERATAESGAVVMGRRLFDIVDGPGGWSEDMGYGADQTGTPPFFVVTHAPPQDVRLERELGMRFTFVDDLVTAVDQARTAATQGDVVIMGGGDVIGQALEQGLVDELRIHLAPMLLGGGTPLFKPGTRQMYHQRDVRPSTNAVHLAYERVESDASPSADVSLDRSSAGPRLGPATIGVHNPSMPIARPPVVSQREWDAALTAMSEREEAVSVAMHELAAARKRMPMVPVARDYQFEGPEGRRSLPELFDGRSQLILYRFYFEEGVGGWPDAGCVGCSSVADGIPQLGLLHARDITFAMVSPAPQANLRRYAERMGWTDVPWYTICTERFSADFGVDEWFGLNVFLRDGDDVYRTYFLQNGGMVQTIGSIWSLMSLTPYGGQSDDEDAPEGWPQAPYSFWYRRHDEFDDPPPSARATQPEL